jgi:uncharacterized membrane protein YozB (DUF420 family)
MRVEQLPTLNAVLNATAFVLLAMGYLAIRRRQVRRHRRLMLAAFGVSALFLMSYVTYHTAAGSRPFPGSGPVRNLYLAMLASHVVLAIAVVPMALLTLKRGLQANYAAHRRVARRTLPVWLYVSLTGVLVYIALYVAFS